MKQLPPLADRNHQSADNFTFYREQQRLWEESPEDTLAKLENFPVFVSREAMTKFVARNELFCKQLAVHGSIVELGIGQGAGLFTWFQLSAIYEPANYNREVIGFDSLNGFPAIREEDRVADVDGPAAGEFKPTFASKEVLEKAAGVHDLTRHLGHIPKVRIVPGDIAETVPEFVRKNPHLIVSLLNIDVDLFEPTLTALEHLVPRMPKGSVLVFDEANVRKFPGETVAICRHFGLANLRLQRMPHVPCLSYLVIE